MCMRECMHTCNINVYTCMHMCQFACDAGCMGVHVNACIHVMLMCICACIHVCKFACDAYVCNVMHICRHDIYTFCIYKM